MKQLSPLIYTVLSDRQDGGKYYRWRKGRGGRDSDNCCANKLRGQHKKLGTIFRWLAEVFEL